MLQVTISAAALGGLGICIGAVASLIWAIRRDPKGGRQ